MLPPVPSASQAPDPSPATRVISLTVPDDVFRRFTDVANRRFDYSQRAKSRLFCELWEDYCLRHGLPSSRPLPAD